MREIMPGDRVSVFDPQLYVDDKKTPLSVTVRPATVVRRYGKKVFYPSSMTKPWLYLDLVDVEFDHRLGDVSKGHFTSGVRLIDASR
jgi:hypothetical protein